MHAKYEPYLTKHVVRRSAHRQQQRRRQTNQDCIGSQPTFCREPKTTAKMAVEQSMAEALMQAATEAAKAAFMAIREEDNMVNNARPVHKVPRSGGPMLKQPTFQLKAADIDQNCTIFK